MSYCHEKFLQSVHVSNLCGYCGDEQFMEGKKAQRVLFLCTVKGKAQRARVYEQNDKQRSRKCNKREENYILGADVLTTLYLWAPCV